MDIRELVKQFEDRTLAQEEWTHLAHLKVMLYYLFTTKDYYKALSKMKNRLVLYNNRIKFNTRYHETRTIFWAQQVYKSVYVHNKSVSIEDLLKKLLVSEKITSSEFISEFYSERVLNTDRARAEFIEPDIKDIY